MKVERERVRETFREYTDAYDATDEKIKLKIDHTYRGGGTVRADREGGADGEDRG